MKEKNEIKKKKKKEDEEEMKFAFNLASRRATIPVDRQRVTLFVFESALLLEQQPIFGDEQKQIKLQLKKKERNREKERNPENQIERKSVFWINKGEEEVKSRRKTWKLEGRRNIKLSSL